VEVPKDEDTELTLVENGEAKFKIVIASGSQSSWIKLVNDFANDLEKLGVKAEKLTENATGLCVFMAINYGGRDELTNAVKAIVEKGVPAEEITEEVISAHIYTGGYPDPELIIRPSGEYRLSNFLIWQSAYSEFWFSNVLWPDFSTDDLERAIDDFNNRNRRFGGV
jgi:undecaprenyl diphosphate synthase